MVNVWWRINKTHLSNPYRNQPSGAAQRRAFNPRAKSHLWPVRKCDRNANDGLSSTQLHMPDTHTAPPLPPPTAERIMYGSLSRLHGVACMVAAAASDVNRSRKTTKLVHDIRCTKRILVHYAYIIWVQNLCILRGSGTAYQMYSDSHKPWNIKEKRNV